MPNALRLANSVRSLHTSPVFDRSDEVKLDVETIRMLLLHVEEHAKRPIADLTNIEIEGQTEDQVTYHVIIAEDAGLLVATLQEILDADEEQSYCDYTVHRLTAAGHEFLETVRDPVAWRTVKAGARQAGVATIKAMIGFASAYVDQKIRTYAGLSVGEVGT